MKILSILYKLFKSGKYRSMEVEVMNSTARERKEEVCVICEETKG